MRTWTMLWLIFATLLLSEINNGDSRRENVAVSSASSHTLRHSASALRHMLGHETDNNENNTFGYTLVVPSSSYAAENESDITLASTLESKTALPELCDMKIPCEKLSADCIDCKFNYLCIYGETITVECKVKGKKFCQGPSSFNRTMKCRYCYQTENTEHTCKKNSSCQVIAAPRQKYITSCMVHSNIICLGNRTFLKNLECNWTKGYSWKTALLLSVVLGGFGVDRFYLGMWQEGIGKLFSFGGLGVWTLVDVILIATGYLGPSDMSLYIP